MPPIPIPDEVIQARSRQAIERQATFKKLGTTEKYVHTTKARFSMNLLNSYLPTWLFFADCY